ARRGFTLIEVLATILLLGIVLPVIMRGISMCVATASITKHRDEATALADSKLNELVATESWQVGNLQGDFGPDWPDYTWAAEVNAWNQGQTLGANVTNIEVLATILLLGI